MTKTDTKPEAKSNAERQREHYKRMKKQGMEKINVYVYPEHKERLRKYAAKLRKEIEG